jgi:hypothetical protein
MPILNIAETLNDLIRGILPKAVGVLEGDINVILSPTSSASLSANREPNITFGWAAKDSIDPLIIFFPINCLVSRADLRIPVTSAPVALPSTMAMTCPLCWGLKFNLPVISHNITDNLSNSFFVPLLL